MSTPADQLATVLDWVPGCVAGFVLGFDQSVSVEKIFLFYVSLLPVVVELGKEVGQEPERGRGVRRPVCPLPSIFYKID